MKCFVTGATGFIGAHVVRELNARGHQVKALVRPGCSLRSPGGVGYEPVSCCLTDRAALAAALQGCDWCFHVAASYHLWMRDYAPMYAVNVEGTRVVIEAARAAGCSRIVHTSTAGCLRLPGSGNGSTSAVDESAEAPEAAMNVPYKRSKWRAEQVARSLAAEGAPVVIVNPTAPFGPGDARPTPTGRIVVDFLNGSLPAYIDTGLNFVHVRDVAVGHILAAEKGRVGERYILGHAQGNWTLQYALTVLGDLAGLPAPRVRLPYWLALVVACADEARARLTGKAPRAPLGGVRTGRHKMFFNPAKAIRELGLPQTPPEQALADAVEWFRQQGYVRR
jgi:dihydroflavonol-4-reductase